MVTMSNTTQHGIIQFLKVFFIHDICETNDIHVLSQTRKAKFGQTRIQRHMGIDNLT